MNILVLVPANDEHKATLEAAAPEASFTYTSPDDATDEEVAAADVIVGNLAADRLGAAARLQLMMGDDEIEPKVKPFPGVREILGGVVEMGGKNFLYTHRGGSAIAYLESFGMKDFFTGIVTSRDGFPDKPAPDAILKIIKDYSLNPAECVMIGDREIDGMAGKNAGIAGFLVTSQTVDLDGNDPHAITAMDHNCHNIYGVARIAGIPRI